MGREPTFRLAGILTTTITAVLLTGCGSQAKPTADQGRANAVRSDGTDVGAARSATADLAKTRSSPTEATTPDPSVRKQGADAARALSAPVPGPAMPRVAPAPAKSEAAVRTPGPASASSGGARSPAVSSSSDPVPFLAPLRKTEKVAGGPETAKPAAAAPTMPVEPPASEEASGAGSLSPWGGTSQAGPGDYTIVNVFFGTDRKATAESEARVEGYDGWFHLTAVSAVVTIFLALILLRYGQSSVKLATYAGLAITLLLGAMTTVARWRSEELNPGSHVGYGNDRGEVQVGTCQVSVPKYHEVGVVERPSILHLEFKEDPRKHVVLMDVEQQSPDEFHAALRAKVRGSTRQEAFVFVHGYNVTFEDAARRTAQLAYDLKFDGAPIFFSWPSQGGLLQYAVDETNVAWSVPHLKDFMVAVARQSGAKSVHLIAHSMGNRALTSALLALAAEMKGESPLFREVVLTAPDLDADVFKRDIAPAITGTAERVTLYASSNDEALALSKRLHGYPRAGESGTALVVVDGVDTIDVSNVDTSLVGHSYYGSNDTVLADLFYVLTEPRPAGQRRWLQAVPLGGLVYWIFQNGSDRLRAASGSNAAVR